jgi:uncharacterized membrane protein
MTVETERALVLVCYALHLMGAVAAIPSVIGLVLNYSKRATVEPLHGSHHRWMIRSFWWALLALSVGVLTWRLFYLGAVIFGVAWLWYVYRHARGLVRMVNGRPMPG